MLDRDSVYGEVFSRRLRAMGIRDGPIAPRSPWQNGYCERRIGPIRRECLDHVIIYDESHLRHLLYTRSIITSAELTYLWLKMRRFHAQFRCEVALQFVPYSVDSITNIAAFEIPTGTISIARRKPR